MEAGVIAWPPGMLCFWREGGLCTAIQRWWAVAKPGLHGGQEKAVYDMNGPFFKPVLPHMRL